MSGNVLSIRDQSRFITREFADTLAGKSPSPYLRTGDPVQRLLFERATEIQHQRAVETAYVFRMVHFWREVSLAGIARTGPGMDECYALLFESAFDLAQEEPEWVAELLSEKPKSEWPMRAAGDLWVRTPKVITHQSGEMFSQASTPPNARRAPNGTMKRQSFRQRTSGSGQG